MNKTELRKTFRIKRSNVSSTERAEAATSAAKLFANTSIFHQSKSIACYLPLKTEFDSLPLIQTICYEKEYCYLPLLMNEEQTLQFAPYQVGDPLKENIYNILEPSSEKSFPPHQLDLVIVPLLAFDLSGTRLGMGKGYYDRTFASRQNKPYLIGLAYTFQQASYIPREPWDVLLDAVLTEKKVIKCHHTSRVIDID